MVSLSLELPDCARVLDRFVELPREEELPRFAFVDRTNGSNSPFLPTPKLLLWDELELLPVPKVSDTLQPLEVCFVELRPVPSLSFQFSESETEIPWLCVIELPVVFV